MELLQTTFHNTIRSFQWSGLIRRALTISSTQYKQGGPGKTRVSTADKEVVTRTRRMWSKEDSDRLVQMVQIMGPKWTAIGRTLDRPASAVFNRYKHLTDTHEFHGPWAASELDRLRELTKGKQSNEINWEQVRLQMPRLRPVCILRLTYKHSVDPKIRHGRWSEEEVARLEQLVRVYRGQDWDSIEQGMGTRTKRQCLERWRWQQAGGLKKGRFTEDEDAAIIAAVQQYGENFAKIKEVTRSERTARNISQHYRYALCPNTDRSPWTVEEENRMYDLCKEHSHNMSKVKLEMNSRRSPKDMWNHYYKIQKQRLQQQSN
ncbi:hypothetical protein BDA99DRAFT_501789 [Phascolomyces articulosus]|uniref:Uncharacterized protein n=1 Tax=Phascolomyces articulosus TaxID=60185 RepID=A0AAD5PGI1_9FUNG|nr:hypothetical protein BDA99DRAFT_501789 [Phascolomyces articulosus]